MREGLTRKGREESEVDKFGFDHETSREQNADEEEKEEEKESSDKMIFATTTNLFPWSPPDHVKM